MRTKHFLEQLEHPRIVQAIADAEMKTSGEIRVYVQHGEVDDPFSEAQARFTALGMTATQERNGILIFVAPRSQKFAVIGDEGIHQRCGDSFWQQLAHEMQAQFKARNFTDALVHAIHRTGELLSLQFPRQPDDWNELPNEIEEG